MSGRLSIVGTGPGDLDHLTLRARSTLQKAEVVLGYEAYLDQVSPLVKGKPVEAYLMGQEVERARRALALAWEGKRVALVSGGDPGIYGMAAPVFEALEIIDRMSDARPGIEVVPGVTAHSACAALLGAPLSGDFAVLSLSDLLTPWEAIARRLEAAAAADFVIVLYNPKSSGRPWQVAEAQRILLRHRLPSTPIGIVRQAFRPRQQALITTLGAMTEHPIDMTTTLIIGNSQTRAGPGFLLTPRGYTIPAQGEGRRANAPLALKGEGVRG